MEKRTAEALLASINDMIAIAVAVKATLRQGRVDVPFLSERMETIALSLAEFDVQVATYQEACRI